MSLSMVSLAEAFERSDLTGQACHASMEQMEQKFYCDFIYTHSNFIQNIRKRLQFCLEVPFPENHPFIVIIKG